MPGDPKLQETIPHKRCKHDRTRSRLKTLPLHVFSGDVLNYLVYGMTFHKSDRRTVQIWSHLRSNHRLRPRSLLRHLKTQNYLIQYNSHSEVFVHYVRIRIHFFNMSIKNNSISCILITCIGKNYKAAANGYLSLNYRSYTRKSTAFILLL